MTDVCRSEGASPRVAFRFAAGRRAHFLPCLSLSLLLTAACASVFYRAVQRNVTYTPSAALAQNAALRRAEALCERLLGMPAKAGPLWTNPLRSDETMIIRNGRSPVVPGKIVIPCEWTLSVTG